MKRLSRQLLILLALAVSSALAQSVSNDSERGENRGRGRQPGARARDSSPLIQSDDVMPNFGPFNKFYAKATELVRSHKIDLSKEYHVGIKTEFEKGNLLDGRLSLVISPNNPSLLELLKDFLAAVDESSVLKVVAVGSRDEAINKLEIGIDSIQADFRFNLSFKTNGPLTAQNVARRFRWLFEIAKHMMGGKPEVEFYESGAIEAEKDQVLIKTKISRQALKRFLSNH